MGYTKELHEMCEKLGDELKRANSEVRMKDKLSGSELDYIDKLTHAMKSIKTVIAMEEANDDGYSERGRMYRGTSYNSYPDNMSYDDMSYARGRGRNAKRDSMGRYSSGYSRDDANAEMVSGLRELMADAPDEGTRAEFRAFINKLEQR